MGAVWINVGEGSLQEGIDVSLDVRHGHTVDDCVGDALVEAQDLEVRGRGQNLPSEYPSSPLPGAWQTPGRGTGSGYEGPVSLRQRGLSHRGCSRHPSCRGSISFRGTERATYIDPIGKENGHDLLMNFLGEGVELGKDDLVLVGGALSQVVEGNTLHHQKEDGEGVHILCCDGG